jgi:phosphate transport system permease protein
MVLPTIIRTTEEALKTVPRAYREGSLALGSTKLQTIIRVVLPSAIPGILTAVILSIGRIVGETAALYLTAGMVARIPESVMNSGRTLSVHLYVLAKEGISFEEAYTTATVLIIIVAAINFITGLIAGKIKKATIGH